MVVGDPRLLGGVSLDPHESALGPDALSVTAAQLRAALDGSAVALKARLMDQSRLAGVGNLIADEVLWRASLSPLRRAGSLGPSEHRRLLHHLRRTLSDLIERGGSHTGDLMAERRPGGRCPRDGAELRRSVVGGRTTWWCGRHQR
jgi:formamidopyrimidine-DNA glycosylase